MPRPPNPDKQIGPRESPSQRASHAHYVHDPLDSISMRCTAQSSVPEHYFDDCGCCRKRPTNTNDTMGRGSEGSHG